MQAGDTHTHTRTRTRTRTLVQAPPIVMAARPISGGLILLDKSRVLACANLRPYGETTAEIVYALLLE